MKYLVGLFIAIIIILVLFTWILSHEDKDKILYKSVPGTQYKIYNPFEDGNVATTMDALKYIQENNGILVPDSGSISTTPDKAVLKSLPSVVTVGTAQERFMDKIYKIDNNNSFNLSYKQQERLESNNNGAPQVSRKISQFSCSDYFKDCPKWSETNQCNINPEYMLFACPSSCNVCNWTPIQKTAYAYAKNKTNPQSEVYNGKPYPPLPAELSGPGFPINTLGSLNLDTTIY